MTRSKWSMQNSIFLPQSGYEVTQASLSTDDEYYYIDEPYTEEVLSLDDGRVMRVIEEYWFSEPPCTEPYARWCERSGKFI